MGEYGNYSRNTARLPGHESQTLDGIDIKHKTPKDLEKEKINSISSQAFESIQQLKETKKELSKKIKTCQEQIIKLEGLQDEKYEGHIVKLKSAVELLTQKKTEIKGEIKGMLSDVKTISQETALAKKESRLEKQVETIAKREEKIEKQQKKIEKEQAKVEAFQEIQEQKFSEIEFESKEVQNKEAEEQVRDAHIVKTESIEAVQWSKEIEKNGFKNAFTIIDNRTVPLPKPTNENEMQNLIKLLSEKKIAFFQAEKKAVHIPENFEFKFSKGDKVNILNEADEIVEMTIEHINVMSDEDYGEFTTAFINHAQTIMLQQNKQEFMSTDKKEEVKHFKSENEMKFRPRETDKHVGKPQKPQKNKEKVIKILKEFNTAEGLRRERARLDEEKEKLIKRQEILRDFIHEWQKKDANLEIDLSNAEIINQIVKAEKIKLSEAIPLIKQEITDLENKIEFINGNMDKLSKIKINKPRNLKRTAL